MSFPRVQNKGRQTEIRALTRPRPLRVIPKTGAAIVRGCRAFLGMPYAASLG
jgi:hypothetical protein